MAARAFAFVLRLFPGWFRDRYGDDINRDFLTRSHELGRRAGNGARLAFQVRSILAVPGQAVRVGWRGQHGVGPVVSSTRSNGRRLVTSGWANDLKSAVRSLGRRPGFAMGVACTFALGIGATTTVYSVVDGVMLRPLPYREPSALVTLGSVMPNAAWMDGAADLQNLRVINWRNLARFQERTRSLESVGAIMEARLLRLPVDDGWVATRAPAVSSGLFETLGVVPVLGRSFLPEEYGARQRNADGLVEPAALITYGAWQRRYGGDTAVVGQPLEGNGPVLVGVLPPGFRPLEAFGEAPADFYLPFHADDEARGYNVVALARLRPGVSLEQARAEAPGIAAELAAAFPDDNLLPDGTHLGIGLNGLHAQTVGASGRMLGLFLGAAGLLLLLAAMNGATLLLSRSLDRSRELGVRMALGASRTRLVRLLVSEAGLLALVGGGLGILLAYVGVEALLRYAPASLPIPLLSTVRVDARVVSVAALVSLGTGVAARLLPAWRLTRSGLGGGMSRIGHASAERTSGLRAVLVGGQMAVAIVLLSGAALLFNSFVRLTTVDPGFEADGLVSMMEAYKGSAAAEGTDALWQVWDVLLDELRSVPGVESVAGTTGLPFGAPFWTPPILLPGEAPSALREIAGYAITPGYLATAGTTLLQGRGFDRLDGPQAERVVVVNESFVRTELGGADPLNLIVRRRRWQYETGEPVATLVPMRIVGVVEDVVQARPEEGLRPAIYVPYTQFEEATFISAAVRTSRPPNTVISDLRRVSAWFTPARQRVIVTMDNRMATTRASPRFNAMLTGAFALVAVLLAATGLYGSMLHAVWRRRREFGVRMALGANRAGVVRMVLGQGLRLSTAGLACGAVCTLVSARVLGSFLYEVRPTDPATLLTVGAVLVLVSVVACLVPARRATAIDPATVLKAD